MGHQTILLISATVKLKSGELEIDINSTLSLVMLGTIESTTTHRT